MLWFVTGCSSGLGFSLCRAILEAGHQCIASSRKPSMTPEAVDEIEKLGAEAEHGPIQVLINNAGFASGGVFEHYELSQARALMETNFFGAMRTMKTIIPSMRERNHGVIVNISSAEFWEPHPLAGVYCASKFAIEGLSESVATELASFNIRTLIVEPGGMRTAFMSNVEFPALPDAYKGTIVEHVMNALASMDGFDQDPERTAKAIVQEVLKPSADPPLLRMPLGKESVSKMKQKGEAWKMVADAREEVALTVDYPKEG